MNSSAGPLFLTCIETRKSRVKTHCCAGILLVFTLALSCVSARGQVPQLTLSSPNNITNPFLVLQDTSGDTGKFPLISLQGASQANSFGIEVTSQSTSGTGATLDLSTLMSAGFGGLTLAQTGAASVTAVQGSPVLSLCGQQWTGTGSSTPACWSFQVTGTPGLNAQDILNLSRVTSNGTHNITLEVPDALNIAAGTNTTGGQLTIGSMPATNADVHSKLVTLVGANTSSGSGSALAGPTQVFPGFLNGGSPSTMPGATEGSLQIGIAVKGIREYNCGPTRLLQPDGWQFLTDRPSLRECYASRAVAWRVF